MQGGAKIYCRSSGRYASRQPSRGGKGCLITASEPYQLYTDAPPSPHKHSLVFRKLNKLYDLVREQCATQQRPTEPPRLHAYGMPKCKSQGDMLNADQMQSKKLCAKAWNYMSTKESLHQNITKLQ